MRAWGAHRIKPLAIGLILLLASISSQMNSSAGVNNPLLRSLGEYPLHEPISSSAHKNNEQTKILNFALLRDFIKNRLITEYGAFPLKQKGDEFINSTYYGYVTLYLLGEYKFVKEKAEEALDYFYDEKTGGFREWFGGNATLKGTLWGILLVDFLNISPSEYDILMPLRFINETLINETIKNIDLIEAALLIKVILRYQDIIVRENLTVIENLVGELINYILDLYNPMDGLFRDSRVSLSPIIQTYFALDALIRYNSSLINSTLSKNILSGILAYQYISANSKEKLNGGFGYEVPTVFETGVVVDMICSLSKKIPSNTTLGNLIRNNTFWHNITKFINSSQLESGGISRNPLSEDVDIFQSFGALIAFLALGKLRQHIKVTVKVEPSTQIAIDYNKSIQAEISVKYFNKPLRLLRGYIRIQNMITGEINTSTVIREKEDGYIVDITRIVSYQFGNYLASVLLWKNISLSPLMANVSFYFRIGYNISLSLSSDYVHPGDRVNITLSIQFYNGTPVSNSSLILRLYRKCNNITYFYKSTMLNGSKSITLTYEFPPNISLGEYVISAVINDTHGYNHTFAFRYIQVDDIILYGEISEKHDKYYIGDNVLLLIENLTYNSTGEPISTDANISVEIRYQKLNTKYGDLNGVLLRNGSQTVATVNTSLPYTLPKELNITFYLVLTWDNTSAGTKMVRLFNATLTIGELDIDNISILLNSSVKPINETTLYIGETYNISMKLIHKFNSSILGVRKKIPIENATLRMYFEYINRSWSKTDVKYNSSLKEYICTLYIDPNLPATLHNLTIQVFLDFNSSYVNITKQILIGGIPKVISWYAPSRIHVGEPFVATFKLICNHTNKYLMNVSLLANVSLPNDNENKTILVPVAYINDTYYVSLSIDFETKITGTIFRTSDNLTVYNFSAEFVAEKRPFSIDPWIIPTVTIAVSYISYILLRNRYLSRVSRRFLIERRSRRD